MTKLEPAKVTWKNPATPEAAAFGDVYFSAADGLAESRYVFLEGIGAPEIWTGRGNFVVGETGFGTGLNFLAAWDMWRRSAKEGDRLHYVSVEGFPLERETLTRALAHWTELAPLSTELLAAYPPLHPGFHRLVLDGGRVSLTLLFGPVEEMLTQLVGQVDAWFLDGFAPSRNPDMWRPGVFSLMADRSAADARLATFTAAGQVRRDLQTAGFEMRKEKGFGHKRECLRGVFAAAPRRGRPDAPWFTPPAALDRGSHLAVVGGGIAGLSCAHALIRAGYQATVLERSPQLGAVGSGNPVALLQPRLTAALSLEGRFNATAYLHACRHYDHLSDGGLDIWQADRGVAQLARNDEELARFDRLVAEGRLPPEDMQRLDAAVLSDRLGLPVGRAGVWFPRAGCIRPVSLLTQLAEGLDIRLGTSVLGASPQNGGWRLELADGVSMDVSAVVVASAAEAASLIDLPQVPLTANRGQLTLVPETPASAGLRAGLSCGGYLTPALPVTPGSDERFHVAGASFARWPGGAAKPGWDQLRQEEHQSNLAGVTGLSPALADMTASGGRAALRATTPDHMPVAGPVQDEAAFEGAYENLHHGKRPDSQPDAGWRAGLYCLTGLASRGFQTAPLLAEMLADQLTGSPLPLEREIADALHPARFQIRSLKRPPARRGFASGGEAG